MTLKKEPRQRYSLSEREVLALLSDRFTSSDDLIEMYYAERNRPFDPRGSFNVLINNLIKKMRYNGERFIIERSPARPGPKPSNLRIVRRMR